MGTNHLCDFEDVARIRRAATNLLQEIEKLSDKQSDDRNVIGLREQLRRHEIDLIKTALLHTGGNQRRAAKLLQIGVTTLHEKIKRLGIDVLDED